MFELQEWKDAFAEFARRRDKATKEALEKERRRAEAQAREAAEAKLNATPGGPP